MSEETAQSAPSKASNTNNPLTKIVALVVFGITAIATLFLLAATALGKDSALSGLAAVLPVENIPFLSSLRKSNEELISDAFSTQLDPDKIKALGGRESKSALKLQLEGEQTAEIPAFTVTADITGTASMPKNGESAKMNAAVNANISAGVFSFDTGEGGIDMEMLIPNKNEMYMKFHVSDKVKDTLDLMLNSRASVAQNQGLAAKPPDIDKYLDKYIYLNMAEIQKLQNELAKRPGMPEPTIDQQKVREALEELIKTVKPDLLQFANNTSAKISKDAKISLLGREKIAGQTAMVFELDIDESKLPDTTLSAIDDIMALVKTHRAAFEKFCEATSPPTSMYGKDCKAQFDEMEADFAEFKGDKRDKARESIEKLFRMFELTGFKVYVNVVDNTLMKSEAMIKFNVDELQSSMGKGAPKLKVFTISYNQEEVSRGKDFTVEAPTDSINWVEEIRNMPKPSPFVPSNTLPIDRPSTRIPVR